MCSRVQCPICHRPSYAGCGNHVEQVLSDVPSSQRCQCDDRPLQPTPKRSWFGARTA